MLSIINDSFNTREIAIAIILLVLVSYSLVKSNKETLDSFKDLFKALFNKVLLIPIFIMFLYSLGLVFILDEIGLWEKHQIKNYIFWLISVGALTHFRMETYSIKKVFKDTLSLIAIFQFVLTFYTFNLFFELIFLTFSAFLYMGKTIIDKDDESMKLLLKLIDTLLFILGFIVLFLTVKKYIYDFNEFVNTKTFYDFFIPTFLTFMVIPYFFVFFMIQRYKNAFLALNTTIKDESYLKSAKLRGIIAFNLDSKSFEKWSKGLFLYDFDKENLKRSIKDIKKLNKVQKNIYKVNLKYGWHPFLVNSFLKDYDIDIKDYRKAYGDAWSGTSNYIKIHKENSHIYYRIEGNIKYITKLEVQLFFFIKDKINIEKSYNLFVNICNDLSIKAINHELPDNVLNALISENDLKISYFHKDFIVKHQAFETGAYKLKFTIDNRIK